MKNRRILKALALAAILPLASCDFIHSVVDPSDSTGTEPESTVQSSTQSSIESTISSIDSSISSNSSTSSSIDSGSQESGQNATFRHNFIQDDFEKSGGAVEINGLTFTYTSFTYLGQHNTAVQIGSAANPQTTPWVLSTVLPENTHVLGWSATVENASKGSATLDVKYGDHSFSQNFTTSGGPQTIFENSVDVPAESFELTLTAKEKAIYFYDLSITLYNPDGLLTGIGDDSGSRDSVVPGEGDVPEIEHELVAPEVYYADINMSLTGNDLIQELRALISDNDVLDYGDARYMLLYTDESLDQPGYDYGMWDGDLIPATWGNGGAWQREHVWAASHLGLPEGENGHGNSEKGPQSDLHNLRVACASTNNYHSNRYYDNEDVPASSGKEGYFFPNVDTSDNLTGIHEYSGDYRGDTARICFYMVVRYGSLNLTDDPDSSPDNSMGLLSTMLEWNREDPVDDFERQRNDRIYEYQGNRNPFIDHSELADAIWNNQ